MLLLFSLTYALFYFCNFCASSISHFCEHVEHLECWDHQQHVGQSEMANDLPVWVLVDILTNQNTIVLCFAKIPQNFHTWEAYIHTYLLFNRWWKACVPQIARSISDHLPRIFRNLSLDMRHFVTVWNIRWVVLKSTGSNKSWKKEKTLLWRWDSSRTTHFKCNKNDQNNAA